MKIFLDTAVLDQVRKGAESGVVDGVTTNPSLAAKEGMEFKDLIKEICDIIKGPVSAEVISTDKKGILAEARKLIKISEHVVVKVPLVPEGISAVKELSADGIRTNVTLCFSSAQALLAAKAGATYISPFVGRLDDIGADGMSLIEDIRLIYDLHGFETKILTASARHVAHFLEAARLGSDVITIPFGLFEKLFHHPLTDSGLKRFLDDWKKAFGDKPPV